MSEDRNVATMATLVQEVVKEAQDLRRDVMAYEAAHRRERRAYRFMGAFLIGAVLVCLLLIGTARAGLKNTQDAIDIVRSCTTPAGECYERQQTNLVDFRQRILKVVAIITDCNIIHAGDLPGFRACVSDRTGLEAAALSPPVDLGNGVVLGHPIPTPTPS